MPNLRSAFLCVLSAFVLFSCNNNHSTDRSIVKDETAITDSQLVNMRPKEDADISLYRKKFIDAATQRFSVSAKRTTMLKSKAGLKITVDPSVLEKENGEIVKDNIDVSIIELTSSNDLFKSNAATVSNGKLLISGGSYFIDMQSGGDKLKIKKDQSLQVVFPVLKKGEMEIFYGERNTTGDMNWTQTGDQLQQESETINFNTSRNNNYDGLVIGLNKGYYLFNSTDSKVNFMGGQKTIKEMVNILQKKGIDKIIDTVYYSYDNRLLNRIQYSRENLYDGLTYTGMQFRVISRQESLRERDSLADLKNCYLDRIEKNSNDNYQIKLKNNYATTNVKSLGWINCDRFYNSPVPSETNIDLPYAFTESRIDYFILFKSFNGLLNGRVDCSRDIKFILKNIPAGEAVTLIAFTKKDGIMYRAKKDFTTGKNQTLPIELNKISADEVTNLFEPTAKI